MLRTLPPKMSQEERDGLERSALVLREVPAVGIIDDRLQHLRSFPRRWPSASFDHLGEVHRALHQL